MAKQSYWICGGDLDTFALVVGAAERDRWTATGDWVAAEEPTDGSVYIWLDGVEQPGRVPVSALRDLWAARQWVAGPPPGGEHPAAADQPSETAAAPAAASKSEPATGGTVKEK